MTPFLYNGQSEAQQSAGYYRPFSNRYTLSGDVGFSYERRWDDTAAATERFHHFYRLGLSGFVVDDRLMTFQVDTNFSQEIANPGNTVNWYGFYANVSLLNEQVHRGMLRFFPQPIRLRFGYSRSGENDTFSYGISLRYKRPENLRFFSDGKIVSMVMPTRPVFYNNNFERNNNIINNTNNDDNLNNNNITNNNNANILNANTGQRYQKAPRMLEITFPAFYFDYDRTTSTSSVGKTFTSDSLSLRSEAYGSNSQYRVEYLYQSTSGDATSSYQRLTADADFQYENRLKHQRFNSYNRFLLSYSDNGDYLSYSTRNNWQKKLGPSLRDSLYASVAGNIYTADSSLDHSVDFSGGYYKHFSERFNNTVNVGFNVGSSLGKTIHSEYISNALSYQLLKTLLLTNSVSVGQTETGTNYAVSVGLSTRTRIPVSLSYSLMSSALSDGARKDHLFSLDFSGLLYRDIRFSSRSSYRLASVDGDASYDEKVLSLNADFFWRVSRFDVSLGASHVNIKTTNGTNAKSGYTSIRSTVSTSLSRRLYLTVSTSLTNTIGGETVFNFNPSLSWYIREVAVVASYELYKISGDTDSTTNHRVYLRVSRHFDRRLKPFF